MDAQQEDFFSLQEAADILGISRQAVYKKLKPYCNLDSNQEGEVYTKLQGNKRYVSRAFIDSVLQPSATESSNQTATKRNQLQEVALIEAQLKEALASVSSLQATVEAQQAHIDSLKEALRGEQALHMAALQQRLPAGRGGGFFAWLKGTKKQ